MNTPLDRVCLIKKKKKTHYCATILAKIRKRSWLLLLGGVKWLFYFCGLFYPSQNNEFLLMWQTQFCVDMLALD
jgi:hypothetical protein